MEEKRLNKILFFVFSLLFMISLLCIFKLDTHARTIEADVTNSLSIPSSYSNCTQSNGYFWGDDGNSSIACKNHRVKTTLNGVLYSLEMVLKNAWIVNQMAFVNIKGMSSDFRNNDLYCTITNSSGNELPCTLSFNSKSSITVSFIPTTTGNYTLGIYSSSNSAITGINTYGIRSVVITQNQGDNSDVIDNANQNSQNEIDNANQNTQDIINNQNENTLKELENVTCPIGPLVFTSDNYVGVNNKSLNSSGQEIVDSSGVITPYLIVKPNTDYVLSYNGDVPSTYAICKYNSSKVVRSCYTYSGGGNGTVIKSTTLHTDSYDSYIRFSIRKSRQFSFSGPVCNDWEKENLDKLNNSQTETNDLIKDDSVDQSQANSFFSDFSTSDNGGISSIITKPLVIVNNLLSNSSSCSNLALPSFMGVDNAYLPSGCILWNNAPSSVVVLWNIFVCGIGSYFILKDLFKIIEDLKNPDNDKVEVMDL